MYVTSGLTTGLTVAWPPKCLSLTIFLLTGPLFRIPCLLSNAQIWKCLSLTSRSSVLLVKQHFSSCLLSILANHNPLPHASTHRSSLALQMHCAFMLCILAFPFLARSYQIIRQCQVFKNSLQFPFDVTVLSS